LGPATTYSTLAAAPGASAGSRPTGAHVSGIDATAPLVEIARERTRDGGYLIATS
jgi:hypothetical protein